jgi:hypothetical protein
MSAPTFQLLLTEREKTTKSGPDPDIGDYHSTPPSSDSDKDRELLAQIQESATANGLAKNVDQERSSQHLVSDGNRQYWGGALSIYEVVQVVTYSAVAIAGFTTFIDNALSAALHWKELRQGRSIAIDVRGKPVKIADGDTAHDVMVKIQKALDDSDSG